MGYSSSISDRDQYSVSSTPTSQISCPDPTDSRQPLQTITDNESIASGVSKYKKAKVKSSKIKSLFPDVDHKQGRSNGQQDKTLILANTTKEVECMPEQLSEGLHHSNNADSTSLSSFQSGQSEKQPDATSLSSADRFFSLPESQSETSSINDNTVVNAAGLNNVHVLEEELEERGEKENVDVKNSFCKSEQQNGCTNNIGNSNVRESAIASTSNVQEQSPARRYVSDTFLLWLQSTSTTSGYFFDLKDRFSAEESVLPL